ncbi:PREDICTED: meiosis-specific protein MEI4-like [Thamnophis sirtalis]|uniref:Meiosis-specific protein MEI4-like n=1 Tax=Thamnophis sirtalis TaxID=35019 RepID=A0A6I9YJ99_9SAUR|nr:PREDICTED: meiosis-specific protein MEI4-like [Thamnophis sirtalis]
MACRRGLQKHHLTLNHMGRSNYIKDKEDATWYFKTLQLALALAIIRSKPPDKSSKEYAVHLANTVSEQNSKWKTRVEALEMEVLHLRQQLLLNKCFSGISLKNRILPLTGQSVAGSNATECSDLFEDSGCDISSDCTENLPSLSHRGRDFNSLGPPILSNVLPTLTSSKNQSVRLHMQFLQHFIELRNLAESNSAKIDLMKLGRDCSVVSNSFSQLLDGLVTSYNLPEQPFPDFMAQAVFVIATLLNDADFSCRILGRCFKKLEDSVGRLVQIILNSSYLNRFQIQDSISHTLVLFGQCSILKRSTISLLFREISQFANKLQHANKIQAKYNAQYENIFFLCNILEQLLETHTEQKTKTSLGYEEKEKKTFLQDIDQAVLHLSDEFPLLCIYLWRLGTLLNAAQTELQGRN